MAKHSKRHGNFYGSVQSHRIEDYGKGLSTDSADYDRMSSSVRRIGPRGSGHLGAGMHMGRKNKVGRARRGR